MFIPTFVLRDVETFKVIDTKISFAGNNVHANVVLRISSPLALLEVVYRDGNDAQAQNNTVRAEYQINDITYDYELVAKPKTGAVELENVAVSTSFALVAPTQGLYGDERDLIIRQLPQYIKSYFQDNIYHVFSSYLKGLMAEGM